MTKEGIGGFWVAAATPIGAQGGVDHAALIDHANWLFPQGVDGLVLFGTTGEGTSFSAAERIAATEALLKVGIAPERLALGTGFPAPADTVALTREMIGLGLRHALILPPYFYRDVDPAGLEAAFTAILEGVGDDRLRATLYNIPQVAGVAIPPAILPALRARFGAVLAGVKDSSAEFAQFRAFRAACPELAITVGDEASIWRALGEGGTGTICGMGNLAPGLIRGMFAGAAGEAPMREALAQMRGPFVPALKAALASLIGRPSWRTVRAPLLDATEAQGQAIATVLKRLEQKRAA